MPDFPITPCEDCAAPVIEAVIAAAAPLRVDALPDPGGNVALEIDANNTVWAHIVGMAQTFVQGRTDLRMAHQATCGRWPPRLPKHEYALDDRIPPDYAGRRWCLCGVFGEPGDARHPVGAPPLRPPPPAADVVQDAARARDAAILGERLDQDDDDLLSLIRSAAAHVDADPQDLADRVVARVTADLRRRDTAS